MNNSTKIFSKRIKELRTEAGLSQEAFGKLFGISRGAVSYYENGDRAPDIVVLYDIAEYFNVTSDYLIGLSGNSTTDLSIQDICKKTGLSDKTIENMIKLNIYDMGAGSDLLLRGIDYILSNSVNIDVNESDLDAKPGEIQWREFRVLYHGEGIHFLRQLNNILFDTYADINPYYPIGHDGRGTVKVINKENVFGMDNSFSLIDSTGSSHHFDFEIVTKALLLSLNETLTRIRNNINHDPVKHFKVEFDESGDCWAQREKE